jgi:hypothetical protein
LGSNKRIVVKDLDLLEKLDAKLDKARGKAAFTARVLHFAENRFAPGLEHRAAWRDA